MLYGLAVAIRNWLYDSDIFKSESFNIPIISVGNLAVGGTGKTPHTEFIISFLRNSYKTALLSRGYKRTTKGFRLADETSDSRIIGDEPFQLYRKFSDLTVAVDENRVNGVKQLLEAVPDLGVIVLDDAFQHRAIQPGISILLTDYSNLYSRDHLLPGGFLRENKNGSKRADIIIVTKCPSELHAIDMRIIETELKIRTNQYLFFSSVDYNHLLPVVKPNTNSNMSLEELKNAQVGVVLMSGIASPLPMYLEIKKYTTMLKTIYFEDHHAFQPEDFYKLQNVFDKLTTETKMVIVTEKDAARLVTCSNYPEILKSSTYYLPIKIKILQNQEHIFIQKITAYVNENSRNCRLFTSTPKTQS